MGFAQAGAIAVSLGDPAGIGPEIVAKAWDARDRLALPAFFAIGDPRAIAAVWSGPVETIASPDQAAAAFDRALPVLPVRSAGPITPGQPDHAGACSALDSLELAVGLTRSAAASALVTGPVSKAQLYAIGFRHPGQTEFVAERCGIAREAAVMLLHGPDLMVVPITTHIPLMDVGAALSVDAIVTCGEVTAKGLTRNFGIEAPRLAFAGLNPHAGEGGAIGREEIEIIIPALERLRAAGIAVAGPLPADAMFHPRARASYDVALCPAHDQALIPIKTLYFDCGVNMTLGLPIVRTSPDHGTAFGIAGKDCAEPGAMIAALQSAASAVRHRAACPA